MEDLRIENPPAKARIREFIKKNIGSASISDDQDLFDSGIVNSLFSIQLVTFVEKNFNITVTVDDLDIENFKSVNAVFDFYRSKLQAMFESLSFVHQERYENFKRFVSTHVEPFADEWDRNQHMPADIIRKIAAEGYFGAIVLPKYGGQGWDNLSYGLLNEAFGFGSSSLTVLFTVQNMVGSSILRWGTEAQHRSWLEPMAQGDIIAAFALTEPETGSDLQSITVNLEDRSSHLVLNGTKRWITFAATADVILVFGKLNNKPVACIVERDMPGVTITPIKDMMGFRACHLAQLDFENVEIPVENVIGRAGYGLSHVAPVGLHCGRLSTAFSSAGLIRACLEASVKRAGSRVVSGTALNNYSSIRSIIVQMGLDYDTSMLWCLEAAKAEDNRMCNAAETTIGAKYVASQNAMKAAANAIQIGGAYGCHEASSSTGRFYRDAKIMEIIEGTSQVLQNVLGTHYITSYQPAAKKQGLNMHIDTFCMKKPVNEMHSSAAGFRKTVLDEWNNTQQSFDEHVTIQKLFERQVTLTPDNKAVFFGDEVVTYQELNNKANKLALRLHVAGIKPETIVGIVCERSLEMMFGILGIIKAGGAYLPLSPNDPSERLNIIIQDSALPVLLMQRKFAGKLDFDGLIIYLDDFAADDGMLVGNLPIVNKSTDLLYVIYTSGSTGMPKGVMIEHRSLVNRLTWMQQAYPLTADDIILQKTPYNFDVSVWELFWWMLTGAAVCLLMPNGEKNPIAIINTVNDKKISVMHFVPSMLGVFIDYIRGKDTIAALSSLRLIFTSGEALLPAHVEGFYKELNSMNGKRLINLYGPTEATVDVTHHECTEGDNLRSVTIGKPISNTRIYIVDGQNELIGANDEGQLLIAGTGVARGYLNRVELTAEKFIDDIFHGAGKLYKSGDLASWGPDGNINFIGRMDHQVKIRGLRIELGEIEAVLIKHPLVKESLLHVWRYSESVIIIAAYYVASIDIEQVELKAFMKKCLPEYMVPSCFIRVDAFPLSVNGKIDRKALPDPLVATL